MNRQGRLNSEFHFKHNSIFSRRGFAYFDCANDRLKSIFRELEIVRADGHVRHAELTPFVRLDAAYLSRVVANLNNDFGQRLPRRIFNTPADRSHFDGSANFVEDVPSWRASEAFIRPGCASLYSLGGN